MNKKKFKPTKRKFVWAAAVTIWCVLMFGFAYPNWQKTVDQGREISTLTEKLDQMDQWSVAGIWLDWAITQRSAQVAEHYQKLFPKKRQREELFLQLAGIADQSGISDFKLEEQLDVENTSTWSDDTMDDDVDYTTDMDNRDWSAVELNYFRVQASFLGDYVRVASFLEGVRGLDRALNVHSLIVVPEGTGIRVNLEIDCYVQKHS